MISYFCVEKCDGTARGKENEIKEARTKERENEFEICEKRTSRIEIWGW